MRNTFVRNALIIMTIVGTFANIFAATMADAQKAYVAGNWKTAAANYEQVCPTLADTAQAECLLWNVLALSQTGVAADFSKAGKRLDSLISQTNPQKPVYADLMMTKAQFQLYLGRHDRAAEALIHAIETAQPHHIPVLQKVCTAVQARVKNENLNESCKKLSTPEFLNKPEPPMAVQPTPAVSAPEKQNETNPPTISKPASTQSSAPQANPSNGSEVWILQLGAFGVRDNAELLVKNLKKRGIVSKIEEKPGENKILYIVQTGDFENKEKANEFGEQKLTPLNVEYRAFLKK